MAVIAAPKTLAQACVPRESVFDPDVRDTVYNIDDLGTIDPGRFFAENHVTEGMRVLLTEAFKRLEGKSASASGSFLLSQSMGGGKTHNLLALGLLAKHPEFRPPVMSGFYTPGLEQAVPVVTFNGRKSHTPFGIWGEIAEQLGKREALKDFYSPLQAPGEPEWVALLSGKPLLILLDELPPYFEAIRAVQVGATTLDSVTTIALANLMVAVSGGKLPNVCVVLTDLGGSAHAAGGAALSAALADLEKEANRGAVRIDPVRLNTNELYDILRTRLFSDLPDAEMVEAVAEAHARALEDARKMDITTASPPQLKAEVEAAYPFHPAIRELYARFKENKNFQQTRALIRIMRIVVARLWQSGRAGQRYLVGAQDYDLLQQEMLSEIRQINPGLEPAISDDIARQDGGAKAQQIDGDGPADAQDAAKLIFLSSLSQALDPVLGLDRSEIVRALAAPGRDLATLSAKIDELRRGHYLHILRDGKLLYRNIQNLYAKLDTYVQGKLREAREGELRARLSDMFKPEQPGDVYQQVAALPALDEVQLTAEQVTLVIARPTQGVRREIEQFFDSQQYKNRVLFLTGNPQTYDAVLQRAAELSAIRTIIDELKATRSLTADQQLQEAEEIRGKVEGQLYQAVRETFQTLLYPVKGGLNEIQLSGAYEANGFKGEAQIRKTLADAYKFVTETGADGPFAARVVNKLWQDATEMPWADIRQRAATDPSWVWHHPQALETLRDEMVKRDQWRREGNWLKRGPFPKPPATVQPLRQGRDDETGEVTLRLHLLNADTVYASETGPVTTASERVDGLTYRTAAMRVWFLAVDSTGEREPGDPVEWRNDITVKYGFYQDGDQRRCELRAIPCGTMRYTTDGSGPETHGTVYDEPFVVPKDSRVILVTAEADGVKATPPPISVPPPGQRDGQITVNPTKAATWRRLHRHDDTSGTFTFLQAAVQNNAQIADLKLTVAGNPGDRWVEITTGRDAFLPAARVLEEASRLKDLIPEGNLDVQTQALHFPTGSDLLEMVKALKEEMKRPEEVEQ